MPGKEGNTFLFKMETSWSSCDQLSRPPFFPDYQTARLPCLLTPIELAACERFRLFYEVVALPLGIGTDSFFFARVRLA